ncbi:helix-turn-helix domain-containing protein [Cohnella caldifontis]|uniref:helix-turn-helix domain-containing protein n=1 Tax=Cohnella caldifontis TaxID=3027471 RepID=UPI0023ECB213|nr:helix-turn-helix domain-containing protein [Cohnella sp. YIM B05605]
MLFWTASIQVDTDDKIQNAAKSTGYRDLTHVRRMFRKLMGTSPNDYRRLSREKKRTMRDSLMVQVHLPLRFDSDRHLLRLQA